MTPTDKLRALLDERGIEHVDADDGHTQHTWWSDGDHEIGACDSGERLAVYNLTPEQAIAATVGVGTCRAVVCNQSDCVHNCEYRCACTDLEIQDQECLTYRCRYIDYDEEEE